MGKLQKKGQKGAAANYITRQQALKKLQLSLADFRRLCILKGIYPREPKNKKKANKGSSAPATFYYAKDIQFLLHEPLLQKFREYKAFAKKLNKVLHKGEYSTAKSLEENCKPVYTLDHIVKERYPTFIDALRDLDDALSMLFLFSNMPTNDKIKAAVVKDCQKLIAEFQAYVMQSRSLRKVFFSIKGIYYQADIKGQTITWIVPYQFAQHVPDEVDFRVMLTFLEFYQTLMGFVNFRLYNEINLSYPPKIESVDGSITFDKVAAKFGDADAAADADEADAALDEFKSAAAKQGEEGANDDDDDLRKIQQVSNEASTLRNLFSKCVFFISRETPRYALEFMIRSCGGQVSWDESVAPNPPFPETDERITHQISDRPKINNRVLSRTYIQPQWVADCINARKLLRTSLYEPGVQLPPHLSPFVEPKEGDYVPEGIPSEDEGEKESEETKAKAEAPEDEEEVYERELKAEASGIPFSEYQEKKASEQAEEEEESGEKKPKEAAKPKKRTAEEIEAEEEEQQKEMAAQMLSNKQRKLYKSIKMSRERKSEETAKLERKKRQIEERKKKNNNKQN